MPQVTDVDPSKSFPVPLSQLRGCINFLMPVLIATSIKDSYHNFFNAPQVVVSLWRGSTGKSSSYPMFICSLTSF